MQYIVDENGEILEVVNENQNVTVLNSNDRVLRGSSIQYLKDTVEINLKFAKVSIEALKVLSKYSNEIWTILPYVQYATGVLMYSNGRLIRPKGLSSILKKKRRSGSTIIKELCELDVLHKHKDGRTYYFTFNPYVAIKSRRVSKELYSEFKDTQYRKKDWE